jgi:hypothetical protein
VLADGGGEQEHGPGLAVRAVFAFESADGGQADPRLVGEGFL